MKKIMSFMIAVILTLTVSVTAFAAEGLATPDSADSELQIKKDANEYFYGGKQELGNIKITLYGALSDGSLVLNVDRYDAGSLTVSYTHAVGDYYYSYTDGQEAYIYKDHTFYFIEDAYNSGLINDDTLKELAECSKKYLENPIDIDYYFVFMPKIGERGLDIYLEEEIKYDANEYFYGGKQQLGNIKITLYGTLSDGSLVLNVDRYDAGSLTVSYTHAVGDYYYSYTDGQEAYIYKDHTFYFIEDAYNSGLINDDTLKELAECSKKYLENPIDIDYYFVFMPKTDEPTSQPD